ncbi:MAG: hypothetical protein IKU34_08475 [Clostridia bacterium]|nr:hypothetical protein [Clostridia bacterium]
MKNGTLGLIVIAVYFVFRLIFDHLAQTMQMEELKLGGMIAGFLTIGVAAVVMMVRSGKKK